MNQDALGRLDRRRFLKLAAIAGAGLAAACAPQAAPTPTPATKPASPPAASPKANAPADHLAQLIEGTKKEGKLNLYNVGAVEDNEAIVKAFNKTYPFVKIEMYTATGEGLADKVITEARAGRTTADIVRGDTGILPIVDEGLAMKYLSPESANFPKGTYDPEGAWRFLQYTVHAIGWNTKAIPAADAPKSLDDLLNPKYRDKLAIESECVDWFAQVLAVRGREKGLDYMRKLAEQKPRIIKGHTKLAQLVVVGEVPIAVTIYSYMLEKDKEKGAPVEWLAGKPATANQTVLLATKDAPNPNAAKLLIDWWLSKEGQEEGVVKVGYRYPLRPGVTVPDFYKGLELYHAPLQLSLDTRKEAPLFREIFGVL